MQISIECLIKLNKRIRNPKVDKKDADLDIENLDVNPDIETLDDDRVLIEDENEIDPTTDAGIKPIEDDKEEL